METFSGEAVLANYTEGIFQVPGGVLARAEVAREKSQLESEFFMGGSVGCGDGGRDCVGGQLESQLDSQLGP